MAVEKKFYSSISNSTKGPDNPAWIKDQTLYCIYLRSFTDSGTINDAKRQLQKLKTAGFNVIWLMPIYPIGEKNKKGTAGCPYSIKDYFEINPEYGTKEDFKEFVQFARSIGLKVILDMVLNHVALDYNKIDDHPDLIRRDKEGNPQRKVEEWSDVVDLNYDYKFTAAHSAEILEYWLKEYDIDGYRCDVAGMIPLDFWEENISELKKSKKDLFMLAEWFGPPLHRKAFNSFYDWIMYELMISVLKGKESANILLEWQEVCHLSHPAGTLPLRFLENHDLPRAVSVFGAEGVIPFLTYIFCIDGLPLIYNGQEIGADNYLSLFEKEAIDWPNKDNFIQGIILQLINLRQNNPSLSSPVLKKLIHNQIPDCLFFKKGDSVKPAYILINACDNEINVNIGEEMVHILKVKRQTFNSKEILIFNENEIKLEPYQSVIFI